MTEREALTYEVVNSPLYCLAAGLVSSEWLLRVIARRMESKARRRFARYAAFRSPRAHQSIAGGPRP